MMEPRHKIGLDGLMEREGKRIVFGTLRAVVETLEGEGDVPADVLFRPLGQTGMSHDAFRDMMDTLLMMGCVEERIVMGMGGKPCFRWRAHFPSDAQLGLS